MANNGKQPWSASMSLADLVAPMPLDLQPLQASQRYVLVDQWRLSGDALAVLDNFAATAFRVERLETQQDVVGELQKWRLMASGGNDEIMHQGIIRWLADRLRRLGRKRIINFTEVSEEVEAMSVPFFNSLADALRYETELDGHRDRLRKILVKRFGPLSWRLNKRIEYAEMDDLDRWFDRLFDAKSVREIFADKKTPHV
jgi:hypothetical protein